MAQNLVANPGFEEKTSCPEKNGDIIKCLAWSSTAQGSSPDYFNTCFKTTKHNGVALGIPKNSEGFRIPVAGNVYVGLALYFKKNYYVREYLQNKLISPLEKGQKYKISFYISLSDSAEFISDHIAISFSQMPNGIMANPPEPLLSAHKFVVVKNATALSSRSWTLVETEYTAEGGEEYMILGSFLENMNLKEYKRKMKSPVLPCKNNECATYYYLDEISLTPIVRINPRFR